MKSESHPCISDGLGLESVGHEDGGPWKLVVRATGKFLAIVRFCPWCGEKLSDFNDGDTSGVKTRTIVPKRRRRGAGR